MLQIRKGVFETNSSSTHSLIIAESDEWAKLKSGELFIDLDNGYEFVPRTEVIKKLREYLHKNGVSIFNEVYYDFIDCEEENHFTENEDIDFESMDDDELVTYSYEFLDIQSLRSYMNSEYLESYETTYRTKSGDTITIFGRYGNDY